MKSTTRTLLFLIVGGILVLTSSRIGAQEQSDTAPAPIPSQILSGHTAFISNAVTSSPLGLPDAVYKDFYADMSKWGKFTLVNRPSDADLVFEIRFGTSRGDAFPRPPSNLRFPAVSLTIFDPKTHVTLWAFEEFIKTANRSATGRKNLDAAILALVDDVKKLSQTPVSGEANTSGNQ